MNNAQKYLNSLTPEQRKLICSRGGKTVKNRRGLFKDNDPLAKEAGRKGGINTARNRKDGVRC